MDSDTITRVSEDVSSPRFDTVATNRAHPVVPLSNTSAVTPLRNRSIGVLSALQRVRPAVLVVASVLVAAVIVAAATAIYRHQQSTLPQGSDLIAPAASLAAEEAPSRGNTTPVPATKRRANPKSTTPPGPQRRVTEPTDREEVLGTIREILRERSRSRGTRR